MKFSLKQKNKEYSMLALLLLSCSTFQQIYSHTIQTLEIEVQKCNNSIDKFDHLFVNFLEHPEDQIPLSWYIDQLIALINNDRALFESIITIQFPVKINNKAVHSPSNFLTELIDTLQDIKIQALASGPAEAQASLIRLGISYVKRNYTAVQLALKIAPFIPALPAKSAQLYKQKTKDQLRVIMSERLKNP